MIKKLISVIIPVYNEAKNIHLLAAELKEVFSRLPDYQSEFIFVNDGSEDNSGEIIKSLAGHDQTMKYLELSRNFGKEIATTAGFHHSAGDAVFMIDADLQHPPGFIPEFLKKWETGAEVVIGIRTGNKDRNMIKRVGSYFFYKIINSIAAIKIIPQATDFCLLDRKVVNEFNRFTERDRMTRALINWLGFRRDFVYFEAEKRKAGLANYSYFKLFHLAFSSFISLSLLPLKIAGYLGSFIFFSSGIFGLYVLLGKHIFHWPYASTFSGTAELAIIIIFLVGIILSSLGLIAFYIASIHGETINRPLYVIREKRNLDIK